MDAALPAIWIITIACTILAAVSVGVAMALGAYKLGEVAGRLKVEGKVAGSVPSSVSSEEAKAKDAASSKDSDGSEDEEEEGEGEVAEEEEEDKASDEETEKKPRNSSKGTVTGEKKTAKIKRRKKKTVKNDDWEWPVYDQWWSNTSYRMVRKRRVPEKKGKPDAAPFEVTYQKLERDDPDEVKIKLRSRYLVQVATKCMPKHEELGVEQPSFDARDLFIALNSLKEAYQSSTEDDTSLAKCHLKHLLRFLETEYKDTMVHVEKTRREKLVSWNLLWAFLYKDEKVFFTCAMTGQTLQGIVMHTHYYKDMQGKHLYVALECRDYNGRKYRKCKVKIIIDEFKSEKSFESVEVCPMVLVEQSEAARLEAMFLENGRKFYNIVTQGSSYLQYEGSRLRLERVSKCWQLTKFKADGRVMVDLLSFARTNPGYPLKNAAPPTCCSPQGLTCGDTEMPSDEELMLAPAVVYGFSFSNKQWGGFDVNGFSEIHFDDQAFDRDLVLTDPSRKQMLLALVSQYLRHPSHGDGVPKLDPISNKGDGCIFLCYGPPGTGKTLTAESLSEKLHRPLWSISVFELGTTAKDLETNLVEVLDIASQWRAVLLLDEADIYMEKRTSKGDPNRTAMTAIFLRLLEYYRGVLFLTTNRVASFDDAFCSRISMFLRYHRLAGAQREAVWSSLMSRALIRNPDLTPFTETTLNGREIRNTIRIAQTWANSMGVELTTDHVLEVVNMLGEFREDLEGAIKDERDERTITSALARVRSHKGDAPLNGNFVEVTAAHEDNEEAGA